MTTPTTHYGFGKPIVGGDPLTWGTETNTAWDAVDLVIFNNAVTAAAAAAAASTAAAAVATDLTGLVGTFRAIAAPSANWIAEAGQLISRTGLNAALWAHAQASGNIAASDAAWLTEQTANGGPMGKFSPGDGSTNFRVADPRGVFYRIWANGGAVNPGQGIGAYVADQFQGHFHTVQQYRMEGTGFGYTGTANLDVTEVTATLAAITDGTNGTPRVGLETRPISLAVLSCIHR